MYFIYLDEAGNTGEDLQNKDQPIHFISGVALNISQMREVEKSLKNLFPKFLPYSQNFDFEFHGCDIVAGKHYFKHFKIKERLEIFEHLVNLSLKHEIQLFCQGIDKQKHLKKYTYPEHPHNLCFQYLIEKIDIYLDAQKSNGVLIMDKCEQYEQKIINDCRYYREKGHNGFGYIKDLKGNFKPSSLKSNIIDNVMYVDSFNSYFMQLADSLTYIYTSNLVNTRLNKNKSFVRKKLSELAEKIEPLYIYNQISP